MVNNHQHWSRRNFIRSMAGTSALLLIKPPIWGNAYQPDPRVATIVANTIGIDTHNHIDVPLNSAELPGPAVDLSGELRRSGLCAISMTFAVDYQRLVNPGDAYQRFITGLTAMDSLIENNHLKRALTLADVQAAHQRHDVTVIQSVEGGHFLEGKIERVEEAYGRGLRQLGLLHDHDASIPLGDVYTAAPRFGGLTTFGTLVIKECNRLGILVDLTHASNETINAALKVAAKPVIISHTGLDTRLGTNSNMANMMRPRLISRAQAKIVADAGGVMGVWTHLADTPLEYAQNIRAMADVVGVDHVCIGTDTKLTPSYRSPAAGSAMPRNDRLGSNADSARRNDTSPSPDNRQRAGERTNLAWQGQEAGFYYIVVDALLKTGFTEAEIGKIGGGNFCRVFDAATRLH